jgi:MFS family permease
MTTKGRGLRRAFDALRSGDYRQFALSHLLNSLGSQLLQTVIFWQIFEMTGSPLLLGLTGLARALPHIVLSLVGGVVADRLDRVKLIQFGQLLNALLVVSLGLLTITAKTEVWHLYVVTFLSSGFTALTQPARTAILPNLVPRKILVNAVGLNATIGQTSQIVGPAVAGVAISTFGIGSTYILNAILHIASMLAILGIAKRGWVGTTNETPWESFVNGLVFVRSKPVITSLLLLDLGAVVLGSYRALLPIFSEALGVGPTGYGLLSAAPGVGSMVGAAFILSLGDMKYKGIYTLLGVMSYSVALMVFALSPWFTLTMFAAGLLGTTNSIQMIPRNSVILSISPDRIRGRVEAFRSMLAGGGPSLGYTLSGSLAVVMGAPMALVVGAIACAGLVIVVGTVRKELRDPNLGADADTDVDS